LKRGGFRPNKFDPITRRVIGAFAHAKSLTPVFLSFCPDELVPKFSLAYYEGLYWQNYYEF